MKVYTEIIYEWKDGGLKEISSESFDYEGEVTQCWGISIGPVSYDPNAGLIGGGSGTFDTGGTTADLTNIDLDPRTSDPANLSDLGTPNINYDASWMGTGQGGTMGDIAGGAAYYGNKVNQEIGGIMNYLSETAMHIAEFINPSKKGSKVTPPTWESAAQGYAKNRTAAELSANKAKSQARGSLRIDK